MKLLAQGRYISSEVSIADLMEEEPFKSSGVHRRTVELWCRQGEWVRLRLELQASLAERMRQRFIDDMMTERIEELRRLKTVYDRAVQKLEHEELPVRSWEGLMAAVARMDAHLAEQRELAAAKRKDAQEQTQKGDPWGVISVAGVKYNRAIAPKFTVEQEREVSKALYEKQLVDKAAEMAGEKGAESVAAQLAGLDN